MPDVIISRPINLCECFFRGFNSIGSFLSGIPQNIANEDSSIVD